MYKQTSLKITLHVLLNEPVWWSHYSFHTREKSSSFDARIRRTRGSRHCNQANRSKMLDEEMPDLMLGALHDYEA